MASTLHQTSAPSQIKPRASDDNNLPPLNERRAHLQQKHFFSNVIHVNQRHKCKEDLGEIIAVRGAKEVRDNIIV